MSSLKYWVWLATRRGVGAKTALELIETFGSPEAVFFAQENELKAVPGMTGAKLGSLMQKSLVDARAIIADCEESGFRILTLGDAEYPERLKNISDPPTVLYVAGKLPAMDEEAAVAVVGTRECTPYGMLAAEKFGYEISRAGGIVVSGLADGIDSAAARGALRAGARVVGVIGSGLDVVYPKKNSSLFRDVVSHGAIVSEYPPGTEPLKKNFPERNRILSGLSLGVVVIEAPAVSGALITASRALEQGRDVFVVPGNIDAPACIGSNRLLKEGATPVTSGFDVVGEYAALYPDKLGFAQTVTSEPLDRKMAERMVKQTLSDDKIPADETKKVIDNADALAYIDVVIRTEELSEAEKAVLKVLGGEERASDDIIAGSGLPAQEILAALTMLEINGHIVRRAGNRFFLNSGRK